MDAKTQHTRGPWIVGDDATGEPLTIWASPLAITSAFEDWLGDDCPSMEEAVANARLMAAAPDLLGFSLAIQRVVRSSGANLCSTATEAERSAFISGIVDAWNNGGYDAIDKATGVAS